MGNAGNSKLSYHKEMSHTVGKLPFHYEHSSGTLVCTQPIRAHTVRTYRTSGVKSQAGGKGHHHAAYNHHAVSYNGPAIWRDTSLLERPVWSNSLTCQPEQSGSSVHFLHHEQQPKCHHHQPQQYATQHVHQQPQQYATQHVYHQTQHVHQQPQQYATQHVYHQSQQCATQLVHHHHHHQQQHAADAARFSVLMPGSELLLTTLTQPKQHELLHPVHHTAFDREQADYVCVSPSAINGSEVVNLPQQEVHSYCSQRYQQRLLSPQPSFTGGALNAE